jgi:N-acetylglutamate synthase-like GNAT family acetyltransferase
MSLTWTAEKPPRWDAGKQRIVGGAPEGALKIETFADGDSIPGDWWRVERDGATVGYGWMDTTWNGAEILLAVDPESEGAGVGSFILDRLDAETAEKGLNYMFNQVQATHPKRKAVTRWLEARGFRGSEDGQLKRHVKRA